MTDIYYLRVFKIAQIVTNNPVGLTDIIELRIKKISTFQRLGSSDTPTALVACHRRIVVLTAILKAKTTAVFF